MCFKKWAFFRTADNENARRNLKPAGGSPLASSPLMCLVIACIDSRQAAVSAGDGLGFGFIVPSRSLKVRSVNPVDVRIFLVGPVGRVVPVLARFL